MWPDSYFGLSIYLHPYIVYASSEGYDEFAHLHRLALKDLSLALTNHCRHGFFFIFKFLAYLSFT